LRGTGRLEDAIFTRVHLIKKNPRQEMASSARVHQVSGRVARKNLAGFDPYWPGLPNTRGGGEKKIRMKVASLDKTEKGDGGIEISG